MEKMFPTHEASERLKDIGRWIPEIGQDEFMKGFCAYLGGRLSRNKEIVPTGFLVAYCLVAHDSSVGRDGFTKEEMPRALSGQDPIVYAIAMRLQSAVARAAFGDEFGDLVDQSIRQLEASDA